MLYYTKAAFSDMPLKKLLQMQSRCAGSISDITFGIWIMEPLDTPSALLDATGDPQIKVKSRSFKSFYAATNYAQCSQSQLTNCLKIKIKSISIFYTKN